MQKKSKVKIIIITIVLLIIISILAYISAWLVYYFSFNKYTKSVPFNNSEQYYGYVLQEDDGYIYSVFKPDFMDFRGEISITKQIILSSDPENAVPFDCCEFLIKVHFIIMSLSTLSVFVEFFLLVIKLGK